MLRFSFLILTLFSTFFITTETVIAASKPNIIFIMADDLGYGDLGCYGQKVIQTPHIDRMAKEGMKFTQFYAGCTVCAPSRSVLMTGKHMGHTRVRANTPIREYHSLLPEDVTVAEVLKQANYRTGLFGKWGIGEEGTKSVPNLQGFDEFFGYLNQGHAHNYYPEWVWHNDHKIKLRNISAPVVKKGNKPLSKNRIEFGSGYATTRLDYSHDLFAERALKFINKNQKKPFFLYLSLTIPHANNERTRATKNGQEVPDYGIYKDKKWPDPDKGQAAMITRMDSDVGKILAKLKELNIDKNTIVMFTSDNGHHNEGGHNTARFNPNGPLRGMKRDLYEGGIRVPLIVRWLGKTPPGTVSHHISYFGDLMATAAELAGVKPPKNIDSISFVPTIMGNERKQKQHKYLYWEFYERGSKQAVRMGDWKAVRMPMFTGKIQLFNLAKDLGEGNDVAAKYPKIVETMKAIMKEAHTSDPRWKPSGRSKKQPQPGDGKMRF